MGDPFQDSRKCSHEACRSVGLYRDLPLEKFLIRKCMELIDAEELTCPIGPSDYTDGLITFREVYRGCLERCGYEGFAVFLQRLCDAGASWEDWSAFHAERL
jgi:hypothetical protein